MQPSEGSRQASTSHTDASTTTSLLLFVAVLASLKLVQVCLPKLQPHLRLQCRHSWCDTLLYKAQCLDFQTNILLKHKVIYFGSKLMPVAVHTVACDILVLWIIVKFYPWREMPLQPQNTTFIRANIFLLYISSPESRYHIREPYSTRLHPPSCLLWGVPGSTDAKRRALRSVLCEGQPRLHTTGDGHQSPSTLR